MSLNTKTSIRKLWKEEPILNTEAKEPYSIPNCRCQIPLDEFVQEFKRDNGMYTKGDLVNDLNIFFNYLPTAEVNRLVNATIWCLSTGLKNRGGIDLRDFAVITTAEKTYPVGTTQVVKDKFGIPHRVPRSTKRRYFMFREYPQLKALVSPRTPEYFPGNERTFFTWKVSATNHPFFYKRHWARGAYLLQQVFDKTFKYTGYTEEYMDLIDQNIIEPFGSEDSHKNTTYPGLQTPPYVKAAYTEEVITVPLKHVDSKFFTDKTVKQRLSKGFMSEVEARTYIKI